MVIKDDGCGFNINETNLSKTMGIIGTKERIKSVSGDININSQPGEGTTIEIFIPFKNNNDFTEEI